jgi:hypothetical protein
MIYVTGEKKFCKKNGIAEGKSGEENGICFVRRSGK